MSFIIGSKCIGVKDSICMEVCPVDCIVETEEMMLINPNDCIDCGQCLECPVDAIFEHEDDAIEAGEEEFVHRNYNHFNLEYNG